MTATFNRNIRTTKFQPRLQRSLVATACVLALSGLAGPAALAQSTDYFLDLTPLPAVPWFSMSNYADMVGGSGQINSGTGVATLLIVGTGSQLNGSGGSATPVVVTGNLLAAKAAGNTNKSEVPLSVIRNTGMAGGIGTMASQLQWGAATASGVYTATVTAGKIFLRENGMAPAELTLTNNAIAATVTLNKSNSLVGPVESDPLLGPVTTVPQGLLPVGGYTSSQKGSISAGFNDDPAGPVNRTGGLGSNSTGSVNITTQQTAVNASALAGSAAQVTGSTIALDVEAPAAGLTKKMSVTGNSVAAAFGANEATNVFNALAGSSTFKGSVVVTNAQGNIESLVGVPTDTAVVDGSSITANVRYARPASGNLSWLSAPLVVSNNSLSASSAGNTAGERTASGGVLAGNAILFGQGNDVTGANSGGSSSLSVKADELSAQVNADLALLNSQGNLGTALVSRVTRGNVTVNADQITPGGSVTVNQNNVAAGTLGNLAGNLISAESTNFSATAAAANLQINAGTMIKARNTDAAVTVNVGNFHALSGAVAASDNTLSARAEGNVAATTVALKATHLNSNPTGANAVTANTQAAGPNNLGTVSSTAGISATNLQNNYDLTTGVTAELSGTVAINVRTTGSPAAVLPISSAQVTLERNILSGLATGNEASTGVTLSGTNGNVQVGVGNTQVNDGAVTSSVSGSSVTALAGGVTGSKVTVNDNKVSSAATANKGTNTLSAAFTGLDVNNSTFAIGAGTTVTGATDAKTGAAFGIGSSQYNMSAVSATNTSATPFVAISAGATGANINGSANHLNVNGNHATASTTGNRVDNSLSLDVTNLNTAGDTAAPVAGLANLQVNAMGANQAAASVSNTGGMAIGISFLGDVNASNLTVDGNHLTATSLGNKATNGVGLAGVANYTPTSSAFTTGQTVVGSGTNAVTSDFALANTQFDTAAGRSATASGIIGIAAVSSTPPVVTDANLSVQRSRVTAEARNNDASNTMAFGATNNGAAVNGLATLGTSASVSNLQTSSTPVSANVDTDVGMASNTASVLGSHLSVTDNQALGLAVGSSASNSLSAVATNLSGNAGIAAAAGGTSYNLANNLTVNADYGVANRQSQVTDVSPANVGSTVASFMGINAPAANVGATNLRNSALVVTDNKALGYAQGTSANNAVALSGTNVNGVTGAVASLQTTNGNMTADTSGSVAVIVDTTTDTPVVLSNNRMLASAGQNEATNGLGVVATNITGGGKGNNISAHNPGTGVASVGADYSVLNVQAGTGNVRATTTGNMWISASTITGGSATVNDNSLTAKANYNTANNALVLSAGATMDATGGINNVQTTTAENANATVTGGIGLGGLPVSTTAGALTNTVATVAGNSLAAEAGGNAAINALAATAGATIGNGGVTGSSMSNSPTPRANATFAVLNYQGNNASMNASVSGAHVGMNPTAMSGATATVQGNQMLASGYGNTASNTVVLSALALGANQATAAISNVQYNTAFINATISSASTGVFGGTANGGVVVVSGNTTTAQAMGNVAVNRITTR